MLNVIKIGGNVIDNPEAFERFLDDFAAMPGEKILVHGGGKIATAMAAELGIETRMIEGRRVTSPEMRDLAVMVYAGLINKRIVAGLQRRGCDAIGLSGADGLTVESRRRSPEPINYGEVGDVTSVNANAIFRLIKCRFTPVFCAISCDKDGNLLNTNADTIATEVAKAMAKLEPTELTFCFEKRGVLRDVDDPDSVIPMIDVRDFEKMKAAGTIHQGMIPKIANALKAIDNDVLGVTIKSSDELLLPSGTHIIPCCNS